jgi:hypothetical protein
MQSNAGSQPNGIGKAEKKRAAKANGKKQRPPVVGGLEA